MSKPLVEMQNFGYSLLLRGWTILVRGEEGKGLLFERSGSHAWDRIFMGFIAPKMVNPIALPAIRPKVIHRIMRPVPSWQDRDIICKSQSTWDQAGLSNPSLESGSNLALNRQAMRSCLRLR